MKSTVFSSFDRLWYSVTRRCLVWLGLLPVIGLLSLPAGAAIQCNGDSDRLPVELTLPAMGYNAYYDWPGGGPVEYANAYVMAGKVEDDILAYFGGTGVVAPCDTSITAGRRKFGWWPSCASGAGLLNKSFTVREADVREGYIRIYNEDGVPFDERCHQACSPPFTADFKTNQCVKDCPPDKPKLSLKLGQCVGKEDQGEPPLQCRGNPVVVSTGEKIQQETPDYQGQRPFPLRFQRTYRSQRAQESSVFFRAQQAIAYTLAPGAVDISQWVRHIQPEDYVPSEHVRRRYWGRSIVNGNVMLTPPFAGFEQWWHHYQSYLVTLPVGIAIYHESGPQIYKTPIGGDFYASWSLRSDKVSRVTLADGSAGWSYQSGPNLTQYYNAQGQMVRRAQSDTLYHDLTYNTAGQLITVTHSLGGHLQLSYGEQGQLQQLTTPDNQLITYDYDAYGNLSTVTFGSLNGQAPRTRHYHYEDELHPYALTGITDAKGVRYATWRYNTLGRVIESTHIHHQERTTFDYNGDHSVTVTNALNQQTQYNFDMTRGMKRISSKEGLATAHCDYRFDAYRYNAKGLLESTQDAAGVNTRYEYNDHHQLIRTSRADGDRDQQVTRYEWHPSLPAPIKIIAPTRVMEYHYNDQGQVLEKTVRAIMAGDEG